MTFAQPLWILIGLMVCIGTLFVLRLLRSMRRDHLQKFAAAHLLDRLTRNVSPRRQIAKKILFVAALFCCFLALARPQYGFVWEDVKRKGIDILFAVDTSRSMLAQDLKPNRLERAKYAIMDFVDQLDGGDRVGLLPFAGSAYLMCPLTGDYNAFEYSLKAIDTTIIPKGGTDITAAIREAESVLSNEANHKLLILITDGENLEGDALAAAEGAAKKGMRIFTVGVGTREGEIIPISSGGTSGFIKDASGKFVVSRLDEGTLTKIAEKCNGLYVPLGNKGQGLQTIYQQKLALIPKEDLAEKRHKVPLERFQWPLAAAIGLMALEFLINTRKSHLFPLVFPKIAGRGKGSRFFSSLVLIIAFSFFFWPATSHGTEGETAYNNGKYLKASQFYSRLLQKNPDDPKIQFNFGTAAYKNEMFDDAISAFTNALKSKDLDLQEQAYYNRGNAQFKKGQETIKTDPDQTLELWQHALNSYVASLQLKPDDHDATFNRDLVQKRIDELKKEKNKTEPKQQNKDKQTEDSKKQPSKKEDNQDQQGQASKQEGQEEKKHSGDANKQNNAEAQEKKESQPQAAEPKENKNNGDKTVPSAVDNERRKQGKMTNEDAEQLLNGLKNDEGKLTFVPTGDKGKDDEPRRDW
jgi:Ca-activated chloride channel homolog